ncbi:glycosyltransferase family 39 protein, partial [bacterium]|nr:glycosyltransferase family 39 protein [candidate division CSSED10-310 bacterium]
MNRLTIIGFLGVAAVLSIGMLMVRTVSLQSVEHDSCISLIAATGHLGDYFRDAPRNRWVDAAQWQRLLHPDEFGCFGRITRDLCELDIHPPLYFWLLHLWIHLAGVSPESGPVLNGILMLMTTTVIYRLVRRIGISMVGSMAGAIFLLVNASSLETMAVTRQYTLLGLITAGMVSVAVNALQTEDIRWYVGLTILASAAFLTHFQSMVTLMLIAGGVMISVMHVPSRSVGMMGTCTRRGLVGIAAVGVGIGLVLLVFPRL